MKGLECDESFCFTFGEAFYLHDLDVLVWFCEILFGKKTFVDKKKNIMIVKCCIDIYVDIHIEIEHMEFPQNKTTKKIMK